MTDIAGCTPADESTAASSRPLLLDLFCGAGGAARGYHDAGFDVVGIDINPQPNYPYEFVQADALEWLENANDEHMFWTATGFVAVHASPPCQHDTSMQSVAKNADAHPDLIGRTRELLERSGLPYVIENVEGATRKLRDPFRLCGSSFGLGVHKFADGWRQLRRHRYFETNWEVELVPYCAHEGRTVGIYGDHLRWGRRSSDGELSGPRALEVGSEATGIDWMTWDELKEAIPPIYTRWIGSRLLDRSPEAVTSEAVPPTRRAET